MPQVDWMGSSCAQRRIDSLEVFMHTCWGYSVFWILPRIPHVNYHLRSRNFSAALTKNIPKIFEYRYLGEFLFTLTSTNSNCSAERWAQRCMFLTVPKTWCKLASEFLVFRGKMNLSEPPFIITCIRSTGSEKWHTVCVCWVVRNR